ncbi:MAG: phospholipase [Pseudomonadales bacterium]|nr:phospholipase [Pseudomonadales bacterium]RLT90759.1 MAG: phospholipase [Ketobacter sp. GenoA1]RLT99837.1 MAG: phospholipase [Ketobacter sp.]TNC88040.1 MAG: phospholipase [Alcanivorax sp.]HAU16709.1 phospholipase [Gammaproteobacteria bacterium]
MSGLVWAQEQPTLDTASAESEGAVRDCMHQSMENVAITLTIGELEEQCRIQLGEIPEPEYSAARERMAMEQRTRWNPFVITPHNANYILPYSYVDEPNQDPYSLEYPGERIDNAEAKLQISLKVPINQDDLLVQNDAIYFAFTLKAFWQVYNHEISAPFRETNYRPELFYLMPITSNLVDADTALAVGIEHESNGRSQLLSRSWNRIFVNYYYARDNYLISFRPWYRIPEDEKDEPLQASGDDNPDIEKYMGYFELMGTWEQNDYEFSLMVRNNLNRPNYGAVQLDASFPLWGRLRGVIQYFNGYGESLIDYNHRNERLGIGILLTDML